MEHAIWVGLAAGALTSLAYVPQVIKIVKEKAADDISLKTMIFLASGLTLWIVYGVIRAEPAIVIGNAISLFLVAVVVLLKFKFN